MSATDRLLEIEIADAVASARYFVTTIWHDYRYQTTHPLRTLAYARAVAALLPGHLGSSRKAMVYAIVADPAGVERGVLVPESWRPAE